MGLAWKCGGMLVGSPQLLTGKDELNQFIQCRKGQRDSGIRCCRRFWGDRRGRTQPALIDMVVETWMMGICDDAAGVGEALAFLQHTDSLPVHRMAGLDHILKV
jgi:hypothetical protein